LQGRLVAGDHLFAGNSWGHVDQGGQALIDAAAVEVGGAGEQVPEGQGVAPAGLRQDQHESGPAPVPDVPLRVRLA